MSGLANENVQSASFKMLQKALELDLDLTTIHGSAKAPRVQEGMEVPKLEWFIFRCLNFKNFERQHFLTTNLEIVPNDCCYSKYESLNC